jgi:hypothetical protein
VIESPARGAGRPAHSTGERQSSTRCGSRALPERALPERALPERVLPERALPERALPELARATDSGEAASRRVTDTRERDIRGTPALDASPGAQRRCHEKSPAQGAGRPAHSAVS